MAIEIDREEIDTLYYEALDIATKLTVDNPKLFKTTFQCIFWEGCHYLFQQKLRKQK